MSIMQILFLVVAGITLLGAFAVVMTRRVMHAAFWLVLTLLGVAVLFVFLQSGFFAIAQVLIYIGAIAILIIFAVMLTRQVMEDTGPQVHRFWWITALGAVALFAGIVWVLGAWQGFQVAELASIQSPENIQALGMTLVDPMGFLVPFEVASLVLIAAMIGSIYIALDRKGGKE